MEAETVDGRILVTMPVLAVTDHRAAFGSEVDTDLVRAAGLEMQLYEGVAFVIGHW